MIIYNQKEYETKFLREDELVIEINSSLMSLEEIFDTLRKGEALPEDKVSISAFKVGEGKSIPATENVPETTGYNLGINSYLTADEIEMRQDGIDRSRAKLLVAYEKFIFNNPMEGYHFVPAEISNEVLKMQLGAVFGIMPWYYQGMEDKETSLTDLKKKSNAGTKLYWEFTEITRENCLPSREDIEFFLSLTDYEKRLLQDSASHPMKVLNYAKIIKSVNPSMYLTSDAILLLKTMSPQKVANIILNPGLFYANTAEHRRHKLEDSIVAAASAYYVESGDGLGTRGTEFARAFQEVVFTGEKEFVDFADCMRRQGALYPEFLEEFSIYNHNRTPFYNAVTECYRKVYENEFQRFLKNQPATLEKMEEFAKKRPFPYPECIRKADEIFKTVFPRSPQVLNTYMVAQGFATGNPVYMMTSAQMTDIANHFDVDNVKKIRPYDNLTLYALADKRYFNFREMQDKHIEALAMFVEPKNLHSLISKGFVDWYKAHPNTNLTDFITLLSYQEKIRRFDITKDAKQLVLEIQQEKGISDCRKMEEKYGYHFSDNELAIRGRHVVAKQGKLKMYMLPADDYRNFTVGYDTTCCQHYGDAGESCVYKLTTDPFAGVVVIEKNGKILGQGFVWTDEEKDTLVFDNVEFANDNDDANRIAEFNDIFTAWAQAMPYKNIHIGIGYNPGMRAWGKSITSAVQMPTTLSDRYIYSDYHSDARSIKKDGQMQISVKHSQPVVTVEPDEPTRWDALTNPAVSFLLRDCHSSIEDRLRFAEEFRNNPDEAMQMQAVSRNLEAIAAIENPLPAVQLYVVRKNPKLAEKIANPCEEVQELLIRNDPNYIRHIQNPSETMMRIAIAANGHLIEAIQNPTEEICIMAVSANGHAILKIKPELRTENVMLAAVGQDAKVASLLPNASIRVLKAAIDKDPKVIAVFHNPSKEVQLYAVDKDPTVINHIKNPDYDAISRAVRANGLLIRNFQYQYPHLRMTAIQQNGFAINCLKNPTEEEYVAAVMQNSGVLASIRNPELRANIELAVAQRTNPVPVLPEGQDGPEEDGERDFL